MDRLSLGVQFLSPILRQHTARSSRLDSVNKQNSLSCSIHCPLSIHSPHSPITGQRSWHWEASIEPLGLTHSQGALCRFRGGAQALTKVMVPMQPTHMLREVKASRTSGLSPSREILPAEHQGHLASWSWFFLN